MNPSDPIRDELAAALSLLLDQISQFRTAATNADTVLADAIADGHKALANHAANRVSASLQSFQLPVRIVNHVNGPRLMDVAGNVIAYAVDGDDTGSLAEIAATLNLLHGQGLIENGDIDS